MNLRKGFFRLAIFVSVIVTAVSFYFFWGVFRTPFGYINFWGFFYINDLAKAIGYSLMCGVAVWVIYFLAKFTVEGFIGGGNIENEKFNS